MQAPTFSYLTDIYFDFGVRHLITDLLQSLGMKCPLVVTDQTLRQLDFVENLNCGHFPVFDLVETNPTEACVMAGLKVYRENKCDSLVAIGGGSVIDATKCISLLIHHSPPIQDYSVSKGGTEKISNFIPPWIAIPTTSGSGSEVGRAALVVLQTGRKVAIISKHLLPKAAVCDPELTLNLSPLLTAGTGMDALSHCIETFCSPRLNPLADILALDGLERGFKNIGRAVENGGDRLARWNMMFCSLQGGLAFQKGLGAVHSLSHPLGSLKGRNFHHGTLNALFLPWVLKFNARHCSAKLVAMASRLGLSSTNSLIDAFFGLNQQLKLPTSLSQLGVKEADLENLADSALQDHCTSTNPRKLRKSHLENLYHCALKP